MEVVHAVSQYDLLTGSGMYVYELTRVLAARGYSVSVVAENVGGELTARSRAAGVDVRRADDLRPKPPDLLHLHQPDVGSVCLAAWPTAPAVASIHSPWPGDAPIRSERIRSFVCVRPEIRAKIISVDGVARERTAVVLNGVDRTRFLPRPASRDGADPARRRTVLFAATMSSARRPAAEHLLRRSMTEGFDVLFVGLGDADYLRDLPPTARWERQEVWDIETHVYACDEVAGTFVGRTAIEGWMCGKQAWVYDVVPTMRGSSVPTWSLKSVGSYPPPPAALLDLCDIEYTTDVMEGIYRDATSAVS
jgi:glycosyltransferase involved in cell wall biosynthesis